MFINLQRLYAIENAPAVNDDKECFCIMTCNQVKTRKIFKRISIHKKGNGGTENRSLASCRTCSKQSTQSVGTAHTHSHNMMEREGEPGQERDTQPYVWWAHVNNIDLYLRCILLYSICQCDMSCFFFLCCSLSLTQSLNRSLSLCVSALCKYVVVIVIFRCMSVGYTLSI